MTITADRPKTIDTDTGNHDRFSHYVSKKELEKGWQCTALCGKKWIPRFEPDAFPKCPECVEIYEKIKHRQRKGYF